MNIFITGITGYVGDAVAKAFLEVGYPVTGLVRNTSRNDRLALMGALPVEGNLNDPLTYERVASEHDVIVHAAIDYGGEGEQLDRTAIDTLLSACRRTRQPKVLLYTSATWVLGDTGDRIAYEDAPVAQRPTLLPWLAAHEEVVLGAATAQVATAVIRPGTVYGGGAGGPLSGTFESARSEGQATVVGNGLNFLSLVHRDDLAQLYKIVAQTQGRGIFHGLDGTPVQAWEVASAISAHFGRRATVRPTEAPAWGLDPPADALALHQRVGSRRTQALGWKPHYRSIVEGLDDAVREWTTAGALGRVERF